MKLILNYGLLTIVLVNFVSCKEEQFYEKEFLETLSDQYEIDKEKMENIQVSCKRAIESKSILTKTVNINFPAAIECDFNDNALDDDELNDAGNASRINQLIRARARQDVVVSLPQEETLCDLNFNFPSQKMIYDDEILLLMNDFVLISSQNYVQSDKHPKGFYLNDWGLQEYEWQGENGLLNLFYDWNYTEQYCLGVSDDDPDYETKCNIPKTEKLGEMRLDIPKEEIIKMSVLSQEEDGQSLEFSFVTTGDNDNGDCEHAAYGFDIEVKYIKSTLIKN